jgi:hypothetical protein
VQLFESNVLRENILSLKVKISGQFRVLHNEGLQDGEYTECMQNFSGKTA